MRLPSREARYGAYGLLTGLAAAAAGRCGGGACAACLACAVPGAALVLAAVLGARPAASGPTALTTAPPGTPRRRA